MPCAAKQSAGVADRPLSVVHIHGADGGGGAEIMAYGLHRQLIEFGHRSLMLVARKLTSDPTVTPIPRLRGVPGLKRVALRLERLLGLQYLYSPGFRKIHRLFPGHVDVVHLHSLHGFEGYADLGALPLLSRRWPLVMSLHDMWMLTGHCGYATGCERWRTGCGRCPDLTLYPAISRDGTALNWRRKRRVLRKCRIRVAACSQWLADCAAASPIFNGTPVCTIYNAVDTRVFFPGDRAAARRKHGLPCEDFIVLLAANSLRNAWKGAADGVAALNRLDAPGASALVVGGEDDSVARRITLPCKSLSYQSARHEMADVYRCADVLLMPSIEEAFGLVAAEAMACGTAVIGYASGGLPEVVGSDGAGVIVPRGDVAGLTKALQALAADRARTAQMGCQGLERARKLFDIRDHAGQFVALYWRATERS